ncbi:methylated-DNA--[protein]-cysteine S-methyltransferase [Mangrovibrevibacter kandeliae]|uniref:methylated-DNA--[protein]-cysteine S-methyltransferase n=1 Tax=Mangrovibrevibacter kandeliae TaxID=2968473 RepID=UPI0021179A99|nr:methylated-DNA--[protein]-cysteine S-methyltransferase [Aurantimonas sp. CSK15Z-1]MCQ8781286.1 methylated-DNA--[protein]-cysteine S-methyltransferase [Aurantimonas sp. CSK15Z-1]
MLPAPGLFHVFVTRAGYCGIGWSGTLITRFLLPADREDAATRLMLTRMPGGREGEPRDLVAGALARARAYFEGERIDFGDLAIGLGGQPEFFRRIYGELRGVGWGSTTTYGALARAVGAGPERAREVGVAMAKNPMPLLIPCHRVLAAGNRIGGFSAPGGTGAKARMLELEGYAAPAAAPSQPSLFD